jgi:hypothetical protein
LCAFFSGTPLLELTIGDWVVVRYAVQGSRSHTLSYIGRIDSVKKGRFWARFLRAYRTRDHSGFVYTEPHIPDFSSFTFDNVVQKLDPPQLYLNRSDYFIFPIHENTLRGM